MKGFYSTILVVAMLGLLISFSNLTQLSFSNIDSLKNNLIIVEDASMKRTILENNVDKIIEVELNRQIEKENYNLILIQTEINLSLLKYLKNKASATDQFFENTKPLTLEYLMINSSAYLLEIKGAKYAEYSFTSTPLLDSIVSVKLGKDSILYFMIPIGYTKRVVSLH
jgi:hypothetical protein